MIYRYRYITRQKKSNNYRYKLQVACNRYIITLIATRYDPTLDLSIFYLDTYQL